MLAASPQQLSEARPITTAIALRTSIWAGICPAGLLTYLRQHRSEQDNGLRVRHADDQALPRRPHTTTWPGSPVEHAGQLMTVPEGLGDTTQLYQTGGTRQPHGGKDSSRALHDRPDTQRHTRGHHPVSRRMARHREQRGAPLEPGPAR